MAAQSTDDEKSDSGRMRVLVVDDNRAGADALARLLASWGYDVRVVYNGLEVLQAAESYHPDVALLDLGLPGMDGYQLALHLRRQPALSNMALIAITGHEWKNADRRSREYGFDEHFIKPIDTDHLRALLGALKTRERVPD